MSVAACGSSKSSSSGSSSSESVRIIEATAFDFGDASVYKAIELMKAKGIKVTLSNISDPAAALRAVVAGQGDIVLLAPGEAATAVQNGGANVKYIATTYGASDYVILAKNNYTLDNLDGATFAIASPGSAGQVIGAAALTKDGVDISKIKYATVGGSSARVTAILAGRVDLAPVLAPVAVPAVKTGKVKILVNTGLALGPFMQQGLIANGNWLKNTKQTQDVVNAFIDAEKWASTNQSDYLKVAVANKLAGDLTGDEQTSAWQELVKGNYYAVNGAMCQSTLDSTLNYNYASGGLVQAKMPPQAQWFDSSFVQTYLTAHGLPKNDC